MKCTYMHSEAFLKVLPIWKLTVLLTRICICVYSRVDSRKRSHDRLGHARRGCKIQSCVQRFAQVDQASAWISSVSNATLTLRVIGFRCGAFGVFNQTLEDCCHSQESQTCLASVVAPKTNSIRVPRNQRSNLNFQEFIPRRMVNFSDTSRVI